MAHSYHVLLLFRTRDFLEITEFYENIMWDMAWAFYESL
jgi:hypothetical protein